MQTPEFTAPWWCWNLRSRETRWPRPWAYLRRSTWFAGISQPNSKPLYCRPGTQSTDIPSSFWITPLLTERTDTLGARVEISRTPYSRLLRVEISTDRFFRDERSSSLLCRVYRYTCRLTCWFHNVRRSVFTLELVERTLKILLLLSVLTLCFSHFWRREIQRYFSVHNVYFYVKFSC